MRNVSLFCVVALALGAACAPNINPIGADAQPLRNYRLAGSSPAAPPAPADMAIPPPPDLAMRADLRPPLDLLGGAPDMVARCPAPLGGHQLPPGPDGCANPVVWAEDCQRHCPPGDQTMVGRLWPIYSYQRSLVRAGDGNPRRDAGWIESGECSFSDGSRATAFRFYTVAPAEPQPTPCSGEGCLRPSIEQGDPLLACPLTGYYNWTATETYYALQ